MAASADPNAKPNDNNRAKRVLCSEVKIPKTDVVRNSPDSKLSMSSSDARNCCLSNALTEAREVEEDDDDDNGEERERWGWK